LEEGEDDLILKCRVSKEDAKGNIEHLATYASNLLAVLFNVYSQTLPQYRGTMLQCINSYLSIMPEKDIKDTFSRVSQALDSAIEEESHADASSNHLGKNQNTQQQESKMPPLSQTLMDIVITMTIYLPRDTFAALFSMAANIVTSSNHKQLQKKTYKFIPRLAESQMGRHALEERNEELQQLLLASTETVAPNARRDRLAAIAKVVESMPSTDLHFIPAILPEVVIGTKETNEKARGAAYDLLITMGEKMHGGGIIRNSMVKDMPADAPSVPATLEEYFTMVSAGLAATAPHMVSATITAITRILYEFRTSISEQTVLSLLDLMDMFLQNSNREIVRSVLGFVKVSVISLPVPVMQPRLKALIPNLMVWSHEHKAHFKAKVKHIIERMIRRFGLEVVERFTPEEDKKLIANIRKTRDRNKRKKGAAEGIEEEVEDQLDGNRKPKFESEYDEALFGSDSDDSNAPSDMERDSLHMRGQNNKRSARRNEAYIQEDEDEPLDLLDKRSIGNISSTKPFKQQKAVPKSRRNAKMDLDGKLVINEDDSDIGAENNKIATMDENPGDGSLEGGINAYIDAINSRDAARRGRGGRLKFTNKRPTQEVEMDIDDDADEPFRMKRQVISTMKGHASTRSDRGGRFSSGRGGIKSFKSQRKGLGVMKGKGGKIEKSPRRMKFRR
jgi:ribosomal RNA-processing protein 12